MRDSFFDLYESLLSLASQLLTLPSEFDNSVCLEWIKTNWWKPSQSAFAVMRKVMSINAARLFEYGSAIVEYPDRDALPRWLPCEDSDEVEG